MNNLYPNTFIVNEGYVYKDPEMSIGIYGNEHRNYYQEPYIKVYDGIDISKAEHVARIDLRKVSYVKHKDRLEDWKLNSKEKRKLNQIINSRTDNTTVWDIIIKEIADRCNIDFKTVYESIPKPDFTKLK